MDGFEMVTLTLFIYIYFHLCKKKKVNKYKIIYIYIYKEYKKFSYTSYIILFSIFYF